MQLATNDYDISNQQLYAELVIIIAATVMIFDLK